MPLSPNRRSAPANASWARASLLAAPEPDSGIRSLGEAIHAGHALEDDTAGIVAFDFGITNVAANQSAVALRRPRREARSKTDVIGVVVPYRGALAGVSFKANGTKTAGTCALTVYINGIASALSVGWDTATDKGFAVVSQNLAVILSRRRTGRADHHRQLVRPKHC
jgi:hypothetical protein